jgi:hypothetical protein
LLPLCAFFVGWIKKFSHIHAATGLWLLPGVSNRGAPPVFSADW